MKKNRFLSLLIIILLIGGLVFFSSQLESPVVLKKITYKIENNKGASIVSERILQKYLSQIYPKLIGVPFDKNLHQLEDTLNSFHTVANAHAYLQYIANKKDSVELIIEVQPKNPIYRCIANNNRQFFLDEELEIFEGKKFEAIYLPIITGYISDDNLEMLRPFLSYIYESPFWRKNIAQIDIAKDNTIVFYTLIQNQKIVLGSITRFAEKLGKLHTAYIYNLGVDSNTVFTELNLSVGNQILAK